MRRQAGLFCATLWLSVGCTGSTVDLGPSPLAIALVADSAVTALDSGRVDETWHYRCTMGLRVRGNSTISGETAFWVGGSYQLVERPSAAPRVTLTAEDLAGWFGADKVPPGDLVVATRTFDSTRPFDAVVVSIQVVLLAEGETEGRPQALSTSFQCG
jgi:hypothetical protein